MGSKMIRQIAHTFLYIILYFSTIYSQGWFWQNPLPTGNFLYSVSTIDTNTVTAVGDAGTIIRTTNGGDNWEFQISGTTDNLRAVSFIDSKTGATVGTLGTILRTTDYGDTWISQSSGTNNDLFGISFTDANNGVVVGDEGTILRTTNGGNT